MSDFTRDLSVRTDRQLAQRARDIRLILRQSVSKDIIGNKARLEEQLRAVDEELGRRTSAAPKKRPPKFEETRNLPRLRTGARGTVRGAYATVVGQRGPNLTIEFDDDPGVRVGRVHVLFFDPEGEAPDVRSKETT